MRRTVEAMMANVQRAMAAYNPPVHDVLRELDTAYKNLHRVYAWPWQYAEWDVVTPRSYGSVLTAVSVTNGSKTVMGVALGTSGGQTGPGPGYAAAYGISYQVTGEGETLFPAGETGYTIDVNGLGAVAIDSIESDTSLTLHDAWAGATLTNATYVLTNGVLTFSNQAPTVLVTNGSPTVTGTGTRFPASETGWRIRIGASIVELLVTSIDSETQITLAQDWPLSTSSGNAFVLYKDSYELPTDMEPGSQIVLMNAEMRYKIPKIPRYAFENMLVSLRGLFSTLPQAYTDHEPAFPGAASRIRFCPACVPRKSYRMVYKRRQPDWTAVADEVSIPQGFDQVLELMAEANLRQTYAPETAAAVVRRASGELNSLRRMISSQIEDIRPMTSGTSDSSFSRGGLSILPMVY